MPNNKPLQAAVVGVGNRVLCVWDWGLQDRNLAFVRATDHEYFTYLARVHAAEEEGPDWLRAPLAIRDRRGLEAYAVALGIAPMRPATRRATLEALRQTSAPSLWERLDELAYRAGEGETIAIAI